MWIKDNDKGHEHYFFYCGSLASTNYEMYTKSNGKFRFDITSPGPVTRYVESDSAYVVSTWTLMLCTYGGGTTDTNLYVNGVAQTTKGGDNIGQFGSSDDIFTLGYDTLVGKAGHICGIGPVAVFNKELTADDAVALYNGSICSFDHYCCLCLPCTEVYYHDSKYKTYDTSGTTSSVVLGSDGSAANEVLVEPCGFYMSSSSRALNVLNFVLSSYFTDGFTVIIHCKLGSSGVIFESYTDADNYVVVDIQNSTTVRCKLYDGGSDYTASSYVGDYLYNKELTIVVVYNNGSDTELWVDGVLGSGSAVGTTVDSNNAGNTSIYNNGSFDSGPTGYVRCFGVYSRSFSDFQVGLASQRDKGYV